MNEERTITAQPDEERMQELENLRNEIDSYEDLKVEGWRPEIGDSVYGVIKKYSNTITSYGEARIVTIDRGEKFPPEKRVIAVWLFHKLLKDLFIEYQPKVGEAVAIKRLVDGEASTGPYHRYHLTMTRGPVDVAWDETETEAGVPF